MLRRVVFICALLVSCCDAAAAERHALLVGVSRYPGLDAKFQLEGPPNDVVLMRKLLVDKFGFSATDDKCRILSEEAGTSDALRLPTRDNIRREFARLAGVASAGDQVVVYLAGHGSEQPQAKNASRPEPDGLDQIFLPRDVGTWQVDGDGKVRNAIVDDEIDEWLKSIRAKGARLWVIFDCCHAGDITRGVGEKSRFVTSGEGGLGIPTETVEESKARANGAKAAASNKPGAGNQQESMALFYACQRNEKAIERSLPKYPSGEQHGLFTYCLNAVLAKAEGPLSYQELGKRIHGEYLRHGRTSGPTPLVEGGDIGLVVLGDKTITRSITTLTVEADGKLSVDAGRLHGITEKSVFAVYPPPGEGPAAGAKTPLGYVRVEEVEIASASVSTCEHSGLAKQPVEKLRGGALRTRSARLRGLEDRGRACSDRLRRSLGSARFASQA